MSERILITGITGFVGSHLADFILERFPESILYGVKRYHLSRMEHVRHIFDKVNWIDADITDPIAARRLIDEAAPDRVFHCAAESFVSPSWNHPTRFMSVNYNGTVNLLEAVKDLKPEAIFHIPGSGEEFGDVEEADLPITEKSPLRPVNPYAVTKIAQDLIGYVYHRSYGLKVIRTRAFNHEGPRREYVFGIPWYAYQIALIEAGIQEPLIKTGHLDDKRNFTHVRDMVKAYWLSTEKCIPGELYLIGSERDESVWTFRQALEYLIELSSANQIPHQIDPQFVRPTNVPRLIANTSKFRAITGWEPTLSVETILKETLDYWRMRVKKYGRGI